MDESLVTKLLGSNTVSNLRGGIGMKSEALFSRPVSAFVGKKSIGSVEESDYEIQPTISLGSISITETISPSATIEGTIETGKILCPSVR